MAGNVRPGAGGWFRFQLGYTTYQEGIGNSQQEMPFNAYPPEVEPEEVEGSGLPYEVAATQVDVEP